MEKVRALLDTRLRVTLTDRRVMLGVFACLDKQRNLLLSETVEQTFAEDADLTDLTLEPMLERHVGLVLVPRKWSVAVHSVPDEYT